eukprot:Colp12_sorted_trinity150504_noHs@1284
MRSSADGSRARLLGLAHDVHAVVGLEEGHEGDGASEAVVPHGLEPVEALQLLVGQQVHVVQREPVLVQDALGRADAAEQRGQAVVVVALEEEVRDADVAALLEQLGGVGDGRLLVGDHGEGVGHGDAVHGAGGGQHAHHRSLGHVVLHHAGDVLDAHGVDALLGDLKQTGGDVADDDLLEVLADHLHGEELQVARGATADVDPDHAAALLEGEGLHEGGAGVQQSLSEGVVALLLVLVEGLHVLRVTGHLQGGGHQGLPEGEGDHLEAGDGLVDEAQVLLGVDALLEGHGHVLDGRDPGGPVHAHAVIAVVHTCGVQPGQRRGVHVVGEGSPEDLAVDGVHLAHEVGHLLVDHAVGHPVHVVQQRRHSDGHRAAVDRVQDRAVHQLELAVLEVLLHGGEMFLAQVSRAVVGLVVAQDVARVEVVVAHQVRLEEHALDHQGQVVGAVQAQGHLALGHAGEAAAAAQHDVVHQPGDAADGV